MNTAIARALLFTLAIGTVGVAQAKTESYLASNDLQTFDSQSKEIIAGMAKGGRFQSLSERKQSRVNELLVLIHDALTRYPSVESMSDRDKITLFNSQEEVNSILAHDDGKRLICTNEKPVGSHMSQKICMTKEQRDAQYDDAERLMNSRRGKVNNADK